MGVIIVTLYIFFYKERAVSPQGTEETGDPWNPSKNLQGMGFPKALYLNEEEAPRGQVTGSGSSAEPRLEQVFPDGRPELGQWNQGSCGPGDGGSQESWHLPRTRDHT